MRVRALLVALAAAALAAVLVPAVGSTATTKPRIEIVGGDVFKINKYSKSTLRFKKTVTVAKSGRTITLVNKTREPHTLSVVRRSDLPRTLREMGTCFEAGPCGEVAAAHQFPEEEGPPGQPYVYGEDGGLSAPGDSIFVDPKGAPGDSVKFKLTARKGTTLSYFCAFHPWMQGQLKAN